jgi:uncharacterized damage-inducible protein DinB
MTEVQRILDQHDRALHGGAWHGDSVWEILQGIPPEQAFARPLPAAHTIWELVAHMTFWETEVFRRIQKLPPQSEVELNFPEMPEATAENWELVLDGLRRSNTDFRQCLAALDDSRLDEPLSAPDKSIYLELHGVIQHHLYHGGQIALVMKSFENK